MSTTAARSDPIAVDVQVKDDRLRVILADGREIAVPVGWYPRLANGTPVQRAHWRLIGRGEGIHWPDIDEDISVEGLLRGARAPQAAG